jgi:hypothetical protein
MVVSLHPLRRSRAVVRLAGGIQGQVRQVGLLPATRENVNTTMGIPRVGGAPRSASGR